MINALISSELISSPEKDLISDIVFRLQTTFHATLTSRVLLQLAGALVQGQDTDTTFESNSMGMSILAFDHNSRLYESTP